MMMMMMIFSCSLFSFFYKTDFNLVNNNRRNNNNKNKEKKKQLRHGFLNSPGVEPMGPSKEDLEQLRTWLLKNGLEAKWLEGVEFVANLSEGCGVIAKREFKKGEPFLKVGVAHHSRLELDGSSGLMLAGSRCHEN